MKRLSIVALFSLLLISLSIQCKAQVRTFTIDGANNTYVTCVNDSNVIAGYYDDATGIHGFIFNGIDTSIINYPNAVQTYIYGINNFNVVVGAYNTTGNINNNKGFRFIPSIVLFTDLTSSWLTSQTIVIARDINDAGCVVGDYKQNTTHVCFSICGGNSTFHYNYQPTYINSLNATGRRTGFWIDGSQRHGLIYTSGSWQQLDYPGSTRTMLTGMSDSNVVVGIFNLTHSFAYRNGAFKELTTKNAVDFQVHDINNKGRVVGYYKTATSNYVGFWMNAWDNLFRPQPNGWKFSNSAANIWPMSYYKKFDYTNDPYLGGSAPFPRMSYTSGKKDTIASKFFPDWPLFVEIVGEDKCYNIGDGFKILKSKAYLRWYNIMNTWGGSCFGFVQSSFMAWDSIQRFKAKFPNVGPWTASNKIYDLPINDENRKCINYLMIKQYQSHYWQYINNLLTTSPTELLDQTKDMLMSRTKNQRGICLYNQNPGGGGHIVNPYKVELDTLYPTTVEYIYIYDNNCPNDTTRRIKVNKFQNSWYYDLAPNAGYDPEEWGGPQAHVGMLLCWPVRDWYNTTILDSVMKQPQSNHYEIYNAAGCDILIANTSGQHIGFQGNAVVNLIPEAMPMMHANSAKEAPYGYFLPSEDYTVEMNSFHNPLSSLTFFDDVNAYSYSRDSATLSQTDRLSVGVNGLTVFNGSTSRVITLSDIWEDTNNEMTVECSKLGQGAGSHAQILPLTGNKVKLYNSGTATHYDLWLHLITTGGEKQFKHADIPIAANTAHIISPMWDSIQTSNVKVYVDNANNGSIEDTLWFGNTQSPQFLSWPTRLDLSSTSSQDTVHITNNGGGTLNWAASTNVPSWISFNGNTSGINSGKVILDVAANTGAARSGIITFTASGANNSPYLIKVKQAGTLNNPTNISASDGTYNNSIHISWTLPTGSTHSMLYRSNNAGDNGNPVSSWINATSFIDSTAQKGDFYYYSVKCAQDSTGLNQSDFSDKDVGYTRCFTALFSVNGDCEGQPTVFSDQSSLHHLANFQWDVNNDGITDHTASDFSYTYPGPGTYTVKLRISDTLGCADSVSHVITIHAFPALNLFSDSTVCAGQSVQLTAGNGFSSYLWSTGATTASITVDSSSYGYGLHGFYVKVSSGNGCSATATTRLTWDTCTVAGGYTLAGNVSYDNLQSTPLNNTTVVLKQGGVILHQTTANTQGDYTFTNLPAGSYQLTGSCNKAWGGVNSVDALKVLRHFVGLTPLQGLRLTAADVNASASVNSIDALFIAKRFVGIDTSFVAGNWAFKVDTVVIGNSSTTSANLKALCYGDVDASYIPPAKADFGMKLESKDILLFQVGKDLDIPVSITSEQEIGAIALVLRIPTACESILNVSTDHGGNLVYHVNGDELRIAWYSLDPMMLKPANTLLHIKARYKPGIEGQSTIWILDPQSQLANGLGELLTKATISMPEVLTNLSSYFLGQNIPNPFSTTSNISWFMPASGKVVLKVYDLLGNEVRTLVNAIYEAGAHTVGFDAAGLKSGTYNYRIEISKEGIVFTHTKQLILIK